MVVDSILLSSLYSPLLIVSCCLPFILPSYLLPRFNCVYKQFILQLCSSIKTTPYKERSTTKITQYRSITAIFDVVRFRFDNQLSIRPLSFLLSLIRGDYYMESTCILCLNVSQGPQHTLRARKKWLKV